MFLFIATVLYPVIAHIAVIFDHPVFAVIYLGLLISGMIIDRLWLYHKLLLILVLSGLWCLFVVFIKYDLINIIFIPPVLFSGMACYMFARSLWGNRDPFITAIAKRVYQKKMTEKIYLYTRYCTIFWAVVTGIICIESIMLALFAPLYIWSLFCNILNYIILVVCFVTEYVVRVAILGATIGVKDYLKILPQVFIKNDASYKTNNKKSL